MKASNLKRLRISLGLTVTGCAIGVTRQTIINIESGKTTKTSSLQHYELYLKDVKRKYEKRDIYKRKLT